MGHAPAESTPDLRSKKDVADFLDQSQRTVDRMVAAGAITAYRIPGFRRVMFDMNEVRSALTASNYRG